MNTPPKHYSWYVDDPYVEERWAYIDNAFSREECNRIIRLANSDILELADGQIESGPDTTVRSSKIGFLPTCEETQWIFERLAGGIQRINKQFFNFDLVQIDTLQLSEYSADYKGLYRKHIDILYKPFTSRKLSFTVQLSDPDCYEGGDLKIYQAEHPDILKRDIGTVNFFPSWTLHEVTPVTKGTRYSLVGWVSGPRFK